VSFENNHPGLPQSMPNIAFHDFPKSKLNSDFADTPGKYSSRSEGWANLLLNHDRHRDPRRPSKGLLLAFAQGLELGVPFYVLCYILLVRVRPGPDLAMTH
jgi:hypothetical protein